MLLQLLTPIFGQTIAAAAPMGYQAANGPVEGGGGSQVPIGGPTWPVGAKIEITSSTATTISLAWDEAEGSVTGYKVDYQKVGAEQPASISILPDHTGLSTSVTLSELSPNTEYEITVFAIGGNEQPVLGPSTTESTLPDTNPPTWPEGAEIDEYTIAPDFISIEWTPAEDDEGEIDHYVIYLNGVENGVAPSEEESEEYRQVFLVAPFYHLEDLNPATDYTVTIQAVDAAGNTSEGLTAAVRTADIPAPMVDWDVTENSVTLSWTRESDLVTGYLLYRDGIEIANIDADEADEITGRHHYTDEHLMPSKSYAYSIIAIAGDLRSAPAELTATTSAPIMISRVTVPAFGEKIEGPTNTTIYSNYPAIDANGRYIAFRSNATNLVDGGTADWRKHVFVYDALTGTTELVSASSDGNEATDDSYRSAISGDGRYVAFESNGAGLVSTAPKRDSVFLRDRETDETNLISFTYNDSELKNVADKPSISFDGRYTAFYSYAGNLVAGDNNGSGDVFVYDRDQNTIELISYFDGEQHIGSGSEERNAHISANGRYVVFKMRLNGSSYDSLFIRDLEQGTTEEVAWSASDDPNRAPKAPVISGDGRYIAFHTDAKILPNDDNSTNDVFVYDRETKDFERVSVALDGGFPNGSSRNPSISDDGRYVVFESSAANLVENDTNNRTDIFVYDRDTKATTRLSLTYDGKEANDNSYNAVISGNGVFAAFESSATNLVETTGPTSDVYRTYVDRAAALAGDYLDTEAPSWPGGSLSTASVGQDAITLAWSAAADNRKVTAYRVHHQGETLPLTTVLGSQLTYKVTGLAPGTEYSFQVQAGDGAGNWSTDGPTLTVSTLDETAGEAMLAATFLSSGEVELTWDTASIDSEIVAYRIFRTELADDTVVTIEINNREIGSYTDEHAALATLYRYEVRGITSAGHQIPYSITVDLETLALAIGSITATVPTVGRPDKFAVMGSDLAVSMIGTPDMQATAILQYRSWYEEGGQTELSEPVNREAEIVLLEDSSQPGMYKGIHTILDGTYELISVTGILIIGETEISSEPFNLAYPVSGAINLQLTAPDGSDALEHSRAIVWSDQVYGGKTVELTGVGAYELTSLVPENDYHLRVLYSGTGYSGGPLAEQKEISVVQGLVKTIPLASNAPATYELELVDHHNSPMPYHWLVVSATGGRILETIRTDQAGVARSTVRNLLAGAEITITTKQLPWPLISGQSTNYVLSPGNNDLKMTLTAADHATLSGTVTGPGGELLEGVRISASQQVSREGFGTTWMTQRAVSGDDGVYNLDLEAGDATLTVDIAGFDYAGLTETLNIGAVNTTTPHNFQLSEVIRQGQLTISIETKYRDSNWQQVEEVDWATLVHFGARISGPRGRFYALSPYPIPVWGVPGDVFKVCMDGREANLPAACGTAILDENFNAHANIKLEQTGGWISGQIIDATTDQPLVGSSWVYLKVAAVDSAGRRSFVSGQYSSPRAGFNIFVPEIGKHVITASYTEAGVEYIGETTVDAPASEIAIRMHPAGSFAARSGNSMSSSSNVATSGQIITFRTEYRHAGGDEITDATLSLAIPDGTSFVANSLTHNGEPLELGQFSMNGGMLQVQLGTLSPGAAGVVHYMVKIDAQFDRSTLSAHAEIAYQDTGGAEKTETLASLQLRVTTLTLQAPALTPKAEITMKGRAAPGDHIRVYANDTSLLGETGVSPGGYWQLTAPLPEPMGYHTLVAQTVRAGEAGETVVTSNPVRVLYHDGIPRPTQISMQQRGGARVVWDPAEMAEFPYVVVGNKSIRFELTFNEPDAVKNVRVGLNGAGGAITAAELGDDGVYRASFKASNLRDLGEVVYSYEYKDINELASTLNINDAPSWHALDGFDPEAEDQCEKATTDQGIWQSLTITTCIEEGIELDLNPYPLSIATSNIDSGDTEHFAHAGEVYALSWNVKAIRGGYMPFSTLTTIGASLPIGSVGSQSGDDGRDYVAEYRQWLEQVAPGIESIDWQIKLFVPQHDFDQAREDYPSLRGAAAGLNLVKFGLEAFSAARDLKSAYDLGTGAEGKLGELSNLREQGGSCGPEAESFQNRADSIATSIAAQTILSLEAILVGDYAGFGGKYALDLSEWAIEKLIRRRIDQLKEDIDQAAAAGECDELPAPPGGGEGSGPSGDGDGSDGSGTPAGKPHWIIDPSGYVYEVTESNRVEGVTATALFRDYDAVETDPWTVWDADWYGQDNPMLTDPDGRYGWDVPVGQWKVIYQKDGYQTAHSDTFFGALDIPPPRFDVNVPMVSTEPPAVTSMSAVSDDGGQLKITFDRHIRTETVTSDTLQVTTEGGEPVSGTFSFPDEVEYSDLADPVTKTVTKTIRFEPDTPFATGDTYRVTIDPVVQSYAGMPMAAGVSQAVTVAAADDDTPDDPPSRRTTTTQPVRPGRSIAPNTPTTVNFAAIGVQAAVPAGVVGDAGVTALSLDIQPVDGVGVPTPADLGDDLQGIGLFLDINLVAFASAADRTGTPIRNLQKPITLTIDLSQRDLTGVNPERVGLYRYNEATDGWVYVRGVYDPQTKKLTVLIDHLSRFGVLIAQKTFADLAGHWAQDLVEIMAGRQIVNGRTADVFDPEAQITRAEFTALLVRSLGLTATTDPTKAAVTGFADVGPGAWYAGAVAAASQADLINGVSTDRFAPNDPITREQLAVLLSRALADQGFNTALSAPMAGSILARFTDQGSVAGWAQTGMAFAIQQGLVNGRTSTSLVPGGTATRAEATVMLKRHWDLWWAKR